MNHRPPRASRPRARPRPRWTSSAPRTAALPSLVLGALALVGVAGFGATGNAHAAAPWVHPAGAPVLTLEASPAVGNAPMEAGVTAVVSGGVAPYNLSLCFGTVDHTSPTIPCGVGDPDWSGSGPLVFDHEYLGPGNFSVTGIVTDAKGDTVGSTALIVVTRGVALAANAFELTGSGAAPLVARFNESVVGGTPPITLQWSFGDGSAGSELPGVPINHTYSTAGTYVPTLTVTDGAGHQTVRILPAISVSASGKSGALGGLGGFSLGTLGELTAVFAAAALAVAVAVTLLLRRQWRREGNELVRSVRKGVSRPQEPPGPP